jgi:hypothetical protein
MPRPTVIALCGSSKFKSTIMGLMQRESLRGKIVLQHGFYHHVDLVPITDMQKKMLDEVMLHKIEMADEVLIVNVNGYIGTSTKAAIEHAKALRKRLVWYEEPEEGDGQ